MIIFNNARWGRDQNLIGKVAHLWERAGYVKSLNPAEIRRHLRWKYDRRFSKMCFMGDGDKVVGSCGYIKLPVLTRAGLFTSAWGMDSLTHPDYRERRNAIFLSVYRKGVIDRLKQGEVGILVCFPNEIVADTYLRTGWINVPGLDYFSHFLHTEKLRDIISIDARYQNIWSRHADSKIIGRYPKVDFARLRIKAISRFGEEYNNFYSKLGARYSFIALKSRGYLNWRYCDCLTRRYNVFAFKKRQGTKGYAVLRERTVDNVKFGYIVDCLFDIQDIEVMDAIISFALGYFRDSKADVVSCMAKHHLFKSRLRSAGFFFLGETKLFIQMKNKRILHQILKERANWFVTMGDGDFEMED